MHREQKVKLSPDLVRVTIGGKVQAAVNHDQNIVSLTCDASGLTAQLQRNGKIEAEYYRHSGMLIMGAWMAVQIRCSAEQAAELIAAIDSSELPQLAIVG